MAFIPILFRIQEIEIHLIALEQRVQKLNQDPNFLALGNLARETKRVLSTVTVQLSQNRTRINQIEMDLKSCTDHIGQEEHKLYGGKISNPRELEQIQQKIFEYQQSQRKYEDELYQLLEKEDGFSEQLSQMKIRLEQTVLEMNSIKKTVREQLLEIQISQEEFQAELETLFPQIPVEWMERYRKIAASHKGVGMAKLKNNSCGACHVSQSDSLLQKIKRGDDALYYCENCGRIICY